MRQFVVVGHDVPTTPDFPLDALPSEAGRLDVLCRSVTAACCLSYDLRRDVAVHLVLADEFTVHFEASSLRDLHPDERSTAALVRDALTHRDEAVGHVAADAAPGVSISRRGFEGTLSDREGEVVALTQAGEPPTAAPPPTDPVFVLSDHRDFTEAEAAVLAERADRRLSLSPAALHADHAVTVAHNYLDTEGFQRY
ncbi:MAG: tRNA (pseudouridine(54)-N(1))-methyltransferase TrmY [Halorientalis sp.]